MSYNYGKAVKEIKAIEDQAIQDRAMLEKAVRLNRFLVGKQIEKLRYDGLGQFEIELNDGVRISFYQADLHIPEVL